MPSFRSAPLGEDIAGRTTDSERQLRVRMVAAGAWLTLAIVVAGAVWVAATWDRPNRDILTALVALAAVGALVMLVIPARLVVRGHSHEPFLLAWSAADIVIVAIAAIADGGVRSPAMLLLVLTLIFAALSYPRGSVILVSALSVLAVLVVGLTRSAADPAPDPVFLCGLIVTLTLAGAMCAWQAQIQADRRDELARLSRSDPLTSCLNRRGLATVLDRALRRALHDGGALSLVSLDLDDFKAVNDRDGHAAGDHLLQWVAAELEELLRPGDALGRIGGDEFTVLLPGMEREEAAEIALRLRDALAVRVGASVGIACAPADGSDGEALHRRADGDLYAMKRRRAALARA